MVEGTEHEDHVNSMVKVSRHHLGHRLLLDLVRAEKEAPLPFVHSVCFKHCLLVLLWLSDEGYIVNKSPVGNNWGINSTAKGRNFAATLSIPEDEWKYTIANLNS